jgi:hypothetical protein
LQRLRLTRQQQRQQSAAGQQLEPARQQHKCRCHITHLAMCGSSRGSKARRNSS